MTKTISLSANQIKTQQDFCRFMDELIKGASSSRLSLEEYLRALWLLVQAKKNESVSFALLAQILSEALVSSIPPFEVNWLSYKNPPRELGQNQPIEDNFSFLKKMLLYQIADLHQMKDEGILENPPHILWLGVSRQGGNTWYSFTPASFLEAALCGLQADSQNTTCDWSNLAIFLWIGQIYE